MMEQLVSAAGESNEQEIQDLERLYDEIYANGCFVKEFLWDKDRFGATVGTQEDLCEALGMGADEELTDEIIDGLSPMLLFAMPGSGATRLEAVQDAYDRVVQERDRNARIERGEQIAGSVYGTFQLGEATVTAYLPDHAPNRWTVTIERPEQEIATETLAMNYAPIFGPDVSDVAALNEFVEALIKLYGLDSSE